MPEHVVQIAYIDDPSHGARFVEMSDQVVYLMEQWASACGSRVEWQTQEPFGIVLELQVWRDLMRRLQDVLHVKVECGDLWALAVLRGRLRNNLGIFCDDLTMEDARCAHVWRWPSWLRCMERFSTLRLTLK
jgi:hypothetical protein